MVFRGSGSLSPLMQWHRDIDRLMQDVFTRGATVAAVGVGSFPPLNVWEDGDALYAEAEVPGVKSEDLEVSVLAGDLTIRGQRTSNDSDGANFLRRERATGSFNRVLRLPIEVDAENVEATLRDGVLLIRLPKAESAKPRKIAVAAN
jgi:HSP20 family protein